MEKLDCACSNCKRRVQELQKIDQMKKNPRWKSKKKGDVRRKYKCTQKAEIPSKRRKMNEVEMLTTKDWVSGRPAAAKSVGAENNIISQTTRIKKEVSYSDDVYFDQILKSPLPPPPPPPPPPDCNINADTESDAEDEDFSLEVSEAGSETVWSHCLTKNTVGVEGQSSKSETAAGWHKGTIVIKRGKNKAKTVGIESMGRKKLDALESFWPRDNLRGRHDAAARVLVIQRKHEEEVKQEMEEMAKVREEPYLSGDAARAACAYYRAICEAEISVPKDIDMEGLRNNWQDFLFGDYGTDARYWSAFCGIAFSQKTGDAIASNKLVPVIKELCPTPASVLYMGNEEDDDVMMNWSYKSCVYYWKKRLFEKGKHVDRGTGCSKLNGKLLVDAAIMAVVYNGGAMVREPADIMSIPSMMYKKMAIMLHAAAGSDAELVHLGLDVHMFRVVGNALGHIAKSGDYRAQQMESYLPKDLWGRINDKLCSICQLLRNSNGAKYANEILLNIRDQSPEFRDAFEEHRKKILLEYNRDNLI